MMQKKIVVIDYDLGNVSSVMNALFALNKNAILSRDLADISEASAIIIPGVGSFNHGMEKLISYGLLDGIQNHVMLNRPLLGICLGMQLLFEEGNEFGNTKGLGILGGQVKCFSEFLPPRAKLPNVGWQRIEHPAGGCFPLFKSEGRYYFLHSYVAQSLHSDINVFNGIYNTVAFPAVVIKNKVIGCQFHPEKSGVDGLLFLDDFCNLI